MEKPTTVVILIPAYDPDQRMLEFLDTLNKEAAKHPEFHSHILIVDDGSKPDSAICFRLAKEKYHATILEHAVNQGKGRALKTAFNYILEQLPEAQSVVCADCDGQHKAVDVYHCLQEAKEHPQDLILGCRDFGAQQVPLKNKLGNIITRNVFALLVGARITDTQTGLRVLPVSILPVMITVEGERFEYETNVLIRCKEEGIAFYEVKILTVYDKENYSTHFNPITDSFKIYSIFFKFFLSGMSSFILDFLLFLLFSALSKGRIEQHIFVATLLARAISSLYNYLINRKIVFKGDHSNRTLFLYYALVVVIAITSGTLTTVLNMALHNESICKIIVDLSLFFVSFLVQRHFIFIGQGKSS